MSPNFRLTSHNNDTASVRTRKHEVKIYVSDGFGFYWEFRCSTIKMGRYRKPVLQPEDWLKFADHKGLKVGDKSILDSEPNDSIGRQFRIRAQKLNHEDEKWVDV
ncbi:hypothetical protein ACE6H2_016651 [Prunus campanulata]